MKKIIIIFTFVVCLFFGISSISAFDKPIRTETDDKIMYVQDDGGKFKYSWAFNKDDYNGDYDFDLGIKFRSVNEDKINSLISEDMKKEYISFNYHGILPSQATVKVPISKFKDGEKLNLYYYNPETNEIETITSNIIVSNGYASFKINHCSDYFLTLSIVKEATGGNNNNGVIIVAMLVVIVFLIGYTMFKNKK